MKKIRPILFWCLFILSTAGCLFWGFKSDIWQIKDGNSFRRDTGDGVWENLNNNGDTGRTKVKRYFHHDPSDEIPFDDSLIFVTHNKKVRVWTDIGNGDELVYEFGYSGKKFVGSDNGNALHTILLPDVENFSVTVLLTYSYDSSDLKTSEVINISRDRISRPTSFYVGSRKNWVSDYLKKNLYQIIPSTILIFEAIVFLLVFIINLTVFNKKDSFFLGWAFFCILSAVGLVMESNLSIFICKNSFIPYYIGTLCVAMSTLMFAWYTQQRNTLIYADPINHFVLKVQPFVIIAVSVLAWIKTIPFGYVRLGVFVIFFVYALCILGSVIVEITRVKGLLEIYEIPMIIMIASIAFDQILMGIFKIHSDIMTMTRIGATIFFVWTGIHIYVEVVKYGIVKAKSEILRNVRDKDFLTGFKQGNVLWSVQKKKALEKSIFTMIVTNITNIDEFGEYEKSVREDAIKTFGRILSSVFLSDNIYKLQGAKFGILLYDYEINLTEVKLKLLNKRIQEVNQSGIACPIHWVSVSAVYDNELDLDFDGFYCRILDKLHKAGINNMNFPGSIPRG